MAFALEGDQRVDLGVRLEADALAQLFDRGQVFAPVLVDRFEQEPVLHLAHAVRPNHLFDLLVAVVGAVQYLVLGLFLQILDLVDARQVLGHEDLAQFVLEQFERVDVAAGDRLEDVFELLDQHPDDVGARVHAFEDHLALAVDLLAMFADHVVELDQPLADVEVVAFDLRLGLFDGAGDHARFERHLLGHPEFRHHAGHPFGGEALHDVVAKRDEEAARARVALAAGAPAELVVDTARFVTLGANDVQPTDVRDALAQLDVRTAPGHVRGNGHGRALARIFDDVRFTFVLLRVEHFVGDALAQQKAGQVLRLLDGGGADQHRAALLVQRFDLIDHGIELRPLVDIDDVLAVLAHHRPVRRHNHHGELVDLGKLFRFRLGGTGHAGQLFVQPEEVLEGDRGVGHGLALDL